MNKFQKFKCYKEATEESLLAPVLPRKSRGNQTATQVLTIPNVPDIPRDPG